MELLERGRELVKLDGVLADAAAGTGSMVFVSGEAGIGKTRLVTDWTAEVAEQARIAWGACDDLITPIVLGPFRDIARNLGGNIENLRDGSQGGEAYADLLEPSIRDSGRRSLWSKMPTGRCDSQGGSRARPEPRHLPSPE